MTALSLVKLGFWVARAPKAVNIYYPTKTGSGFYLGRAKLKIAMIPNQYLLSLRLGPCPLFKSCRDVTNICSSNLSRASNATKKLH